MEDSYLLKRRNRNLLLICIFSILVAGLVALPAQAFSAPLVQTGTYATCAQNSGKASADWTNCLPSGRWGKGVGVITTRIEPATGLASPLQNMGSQIGTTMRLMLPNMLLSLTQANWGAALGMSQFAASFTPIDALGHTVDQSAAKLVTSLMQGSLPAVILVIGIMGGLMILVFKSQDQGRTILRRTALSLIFFALITAMGVQASASTDNKPATGSPWWIVRTINSSVNSLAVTINLDGINDSDTMMSYSKGQGNCQSYLYHMGLQYKGVDGAPGAPTEQSNIVSTIDRLWQETALRSYVTMQWGNPQVGGSSNKYVAQNAMQAYCHVLEASSGTPVTVQKDLSNKSMGTEINDRTAKFLFSKNGWITTTDTSVNTSDKAKDSDESTKLNRMGIFWETCTANEGKPHSRDGWNKLINNIGDSKTGAIKGPGKNNIIRIPLGGDSKDNWDQIAPSDDGRIMVASTNYASSTTTLCNNVFTNKIWNNYQSDGKPKEPTGTGENEDYSDTNLGDSAAMGWRFDVPNVGATWREANMYNEDPESANGAVITTLNYFYGTNSIDTNGAIGSVIGSFANAAVWGMFSGLQIIMKLMLSLMGLFLIVSLFIQAFPFGEMIRNSLKNWTKYTANLSILGIVYSIVATISTFICQTILKATSLSSGTFFYQIMAGLSPLFAILIVGIFCSKVLKLGNPFSLKSMLEVAGTGALAAGAGRFINRRMRYRTMRRIFGNGRNYRGLKGTRNRNGLSDTSSKITDQASQEQDSIIRAGDNPNLSPKAASRADNAQRDIINSRNDKEWLSQRTAAHNKTGDNIAEGLTQKGTNPLIAQGIGKTAATLANAGTYMSAPLRRKTLRRHLGHTIKGGIKLGLLGAGITAAGGGALALPAGITAAAMLAHKGIRKGMAYHRGAEAIAKSQKYTRSGNNDSSQIADDAAINQDSNIVMSTSPTTTALQGENSTTIQKSVFDPPRSAKPLEHKPKPEWDENHPKESSQKYAVWKQNERDVDYYNKQSEQS